MSTLHLNLDLDDVLSSWQTESGSGSIFSTADFCPDVNTFDLDLSAATGNFSNDSHIEVPDIDISSFLQQPPSEQTAAMNSFLLPPATMPLPATDCNVSNANMQPVSGYPVASAHPFPYGFKVSPDKASFPCFGYPPSDIPWPQAGNAVELDDHLQFSPAVSADDVKSGTMVPANASDLDDVGTSTHRPIEHSQHRPGVDAKAYKVKATSSSNSGSSKRSAQSCSSSNSAEDVTPTSAVPCAVKQENTDCQTSMHRSGSFVDCNNQPKTARWAPNGSNSPTLKRAWSDVGPSSSGEEYVRTRAEAIERYRYKRARRAYTKKIRYQLRKVNADRRPRIKGRFVKKDELHLLPQYAALAAAATYKGQCLDTSFDDGLGLAYAGSVPEDLTLQGSDLDFGLELEYDQVLNHADPMWAL